MNSEAPTNLSPANPEKAKQPGAEKLKPIPHRISDEDVKAGIHDLNDFKTNMAMDHAEGEPDQVIDWNRLSDNLSIFSPEIADFLNSKIDEAQTDNERQRLAETVFVVYWAAKHAHDPNDVIEFDSNLASAAQINGDIELVEAIRV